MDPESKELQELNVLVRHVPRIVIANFINNPERLHGPQSTSFLAVLALFDISGFSSLGSKLGDDERDQMNGHGSFDSRKLRAYSDRSVLRDSKLRSQDHLESVPREIMMQRRQSGSFSHRTRRSVISQPNPAPCGQAVETLTTTLNKTLEPVIEVISQHGGDIIKFAGDAMIVLWETEVSLGEPSEPGVLVYRATKCALEALSVLQCVSTCDVKVSTLGMHIGVGISQVAANHVGGVLDRWEFYISGDANRQMSLAEQYASKGQVALSIEAYAALEKATHSKDLAAVRVKATPVRDGVHVVTDLSAIAHTRTQSPALKPSRDLIPLLQSYVPGTIASYMRRSLTVTSCSRTITAVFIKLSGIVEIGDRHEQLLEVQRILCIVQESAYRVQGTLRQFVIDDKGPVAIVVIGLPPLYHENNALRGVTFACHLLAKGIHASIGVTTGPAFCGSVGSRMRAEYAVVGDVINLAARLMSSAHIGEIFCDGPTYDDAKDSIYFTGPHNISVKGKADPVMVYCVQAENGVTRFNAGVLADESHALPFGCESIMELVPVFGEAAIAQNDVCSNSSSVGASALSARVLVVSGESGTGKTMLLRYFQNKYSRCFLGSGDSVNSSAPFHAWSGIVREMISCSVKNYRFRKRSSNITHLHLHSEATNRVSASTHQDYQQNDNRGVNNSENTREIASLTPRHRIALLEYLVLDDRATNAMLTVLNDLLPLDHLFQTDTSGIEDIGERTEVLGNIILSMVQVLSKRKPILLLFDNAQWMDCSSWHLLERVLDQSPRVSALITIRSSRRIKRPPLHESILLREYTQQCDLERLSYLATSLFLCQRYHIAVMDTQLLDFIFARAEGNPAQTLKLVDLMVEAKMIEVDKSSGSVRILTDLDDLDMRAPRYIRARVMSCIDGLDSLAQMAVKLVSINPEPVEESMLVGILNMFTDLQCEEGNSNLNDIDSVASSRVSFDIEQLNLGLAELESEAILTVDAKTKMYAFNSEEMRLVAYDTMLPSQRQHIHMLYCQWISNGLDNRSRPLRDMASTDEANNDHRHHHHLAILGYHLLRSGNAKSALEMYQKAAVHAIEAKELAFAADCMQSSHKIMKNSQALNVSHAEELFLRSQIEFTRGVIAFEMDEWDKAVAHMTLIIQLFAQQESVLRQSPPSKSRQMHPILAPSSAFIPAKNVVHPMKARNVDFAMHSKRQGPIFRRLSVKPLRCFPRFMSFRWQFFLSYNLKLGQKWKPGSEPARSSLISRDALGRRVMPERELADALRQTHFYRKKAAQIVQIISGSKRKQEEMRIEIRKLTKEARQTTNNSPQIR